MKFLFMTVFTFLFSSAALSKDFLIIKHDIKKTKISNPQLVCKNFKNSMVIGKGAWGSGYFDKVSCSGKVSAKYWALSIDTKNKKVDFSKPGKEVVFSKVFEDIKPESFEKLLHTQYFVDLLSLELLIHAPASYSFTASDLKGGRVDITRQLGPGLENFRAPTRVKPPKGLVLLKVMKSKSGRSYRFNQLGTAELKRNTKKSYWSFDLKQSEKEVFAHAVEDFSKAKEEYANLSASYAKEGEKFLISTNSLLDQFGNAIKDTAATGYVGARYGISYADEDDPSKLLVNLNKIGVLAEIRGGPLKGLRYYYDAVPKTEATLDKTDNTTVDVHFESGRHTASFGMGYDFQLSEDLRITIEGAPKLGGWNLDANVPYSINSSNLVVDTVSIDIEGSVAAGIEVGIEITDETFGVRGWIDSATSLSDKDKNIKSTQVGVDGFIQFGDAFEMFNRDVSMAFLGFYSYEQIQMTALNSVNENVNFELSTSFLGGGIAISWL
jgi:hypothetical protein